MTQAPRVLNKERQTCIRLTNRSGSQTLCPVFTLNLNYFKEMQTLTKRHGLSPNSAATHTKKVPSVEEDMGGRDPHTLFVRIYIGANFLRGFVFLEFKIICTLTQ